MFVNDADCLTNRNLRASRGWRFKNDFIQWRLDQNGVQNGFFSTLLVLSISDNGTRIDILVHRTWKQYLMWSEHLRDTRATDFCHAYEH